MELLNNNNPALSHMERFEKVAVVLFYPFIALKDIQGTDRNFQSYFH